MNSCVNGKITLCKIKDNGNDKVMKLREKIKLYKNRNKSKSFMIEKEKLSNYIMLR